MNIGKPLFWHQGLFLQPQHFQYVDALQQAAAQALVRAVTPFPWGVLELEIDAGRLAGGVLELTRVGAVFPDGTLAAAPANAVVSPRDFRGAWSDAREPLTVYLGVRRAGVEANVTVVPSLGAAADVGTRYASLAASEELPDLYMGGASAQVKTLHFVLRLFWESELADAEQYELLPIARLIRDGDRVQLDPAYAPPALTVQASPVLTGLLREVRDDVIGRAHQLEEYKSTAEGAGVEFSARLMRYRMALGVLGRYAPLLNHLAETPVQHPWEIYGALRQLVGEMSVFSNQVDVLGTPTGSEQGLPAYDHRRAAACFAAAKAQAERLLNEITLGPELMARLEARGAGRFEAQLARDFLDRRAALYLVLRTDTPFEQLIDSFQGFAKLGAAEQVAVYARRALPGLALTYLRVRPESLPHRPNASYFRIHRSDAAWEAVEGEHTLALLWDDAPADLKAEVVVVRG